MRIRIVAVPPGEAPEEVRKAWVGLVLPVVSGKTDAAVIRGFGVLTGPKSLFRTLLAGLVGKGRKFSGYCVDGSTAVTLLAEHAPSAAAWWRENAEHLLRPGMGLAFPEHTCEIVALSSDQR